MTASIKSCCGGLSAFLISDNILFRLSFVSQIITELFFGLVAMLPYAEDILAKIFSRFLASRNLSVTVSRNNSGFSSTGSEVWETFCAVDFLLLRKAAKGLSRSTSGVLYCSDSGSTGLACDEPYKLSVVKITTQKTI